jgi:murein DD-endopeptidase MepM/ murein hydrolase activator NlpD
MDIIVVSHTRGRTWRFRFLPGRILSWLPILICGLLLCSVGFGAGFVARGETTSLLPDRLARKWSDELLAQRSEIGRAREEAEENTEAFSRRIAQLNAHIMRLEAAGQRLTEIAGLEEGEFDFSAPPAVGGPEIPETTSIVYAGDPIVASLEAMETKLADRDRQMRVLEDLLLASRLQQQVKPSGWPIENGYISSLFGTRSDPFSGRLARHEGIDFAGPAGSAVMAVATGIVTHAGPSAGYGNLIEINHGNGYVTRYGHNARINVKVGDRVLKGQQISTVGNTGRSTGPHVHFEVALNGRVVNPAQYIEVAR